MRYMDSDKNLTHANKIVYIQEFAIEKAIESVGFAKKNVISWRPTDKHKKWVHDSYRRHYN